MLELYYKIPYDYRPPELWYRFKCWAWYRHTTVKSRYLDHRYHDRVMVLPHCMFEVLSQFIEKECSPEIVDWFGEYGHKIIVDGEEKYVRDEMQDLYDWWIFYYNKGYQEEEDALWDLAMKHDPVNIWDEGVEYFTLNRKFDTPKDKEIYTSTLDKINALDKKVNEDLIKYMKRLCDIQPYLWT